MRVYFAFLILTFSFDGAAQLLTFDDEDRNLIVYNTYEDYASDGGIIYRGNYYMKAYRHSFFKKTLHFVNREDEKQPKIKVHCNEIWGFSLGGLLFRIEKTTSNPYALRLKGKVLYYENGIGLLMTLKDWFIKGNYKADIANVWGDPDFRWGEVCQVSKSINSELLLVHQRKYLLKTVQKFPEISELTSCFFRRNRFTQDVSVYRNCIISFNEKWD